MKYVTFRLICCTFTLTLSQTGVIIWKAHFDGILGTAIWKSTTKWKLFEAKKLLQDILVGSYYSK